MVKSNRKSNSIAKKYNQELLTTEQKKHIEKDRNEWSSTSITYHIDHCDDICYNDTDKPHSLHTLTVGDALKLIDRLSKQSLHIEEARLDSIIAPMM